MLSMALSASQVFAQSDDARAAARSTATEGLRAFQEERWADAATLFNHAEALLHAPTHLLYYARASVKLGKLVQANEAYLKILRETLPPNAPRAFVDAQAAATAEQPKVEQSLPHLTITVEGQNAKDAQVTVNGAEIPQALIGISAPHDPGDLTIEAIAPGWRSQKATLTLKEGARENVTLKLTIQDATAMPKIASTARPAKSGLRAVGWISVIIGAGALGVGTYFMIDNRNNRDAANALCNLPNGVCPSSQRATIEAYDSAANTSAIVSWITYSAGAAFAGAGVIMLIASLRGGSEAPAPAKSGLAVHPWFGFGSVGLSGSF